MGDLGVCAVDGSGSESSSSSLCLEVGVVASLGVPGTEVEGDDKDDIESE